VDRKLCKFSLKVRVISSNDEDTFKVLSAIQMLLIDLQEMSKTTKVTMEDDPHTLEERNSSKGMAASGRMLFAKGRECHSARPVQIHLTTEHERGNLLLTTGKKDIQFLLSNK
jgi:hypothetical protein